MKKIIFISIFLINILSFAKVTQELNVDEKGNFSGSASLQLVAKGKIVEKPNKVFFVIDENDRNNFIFHVYEDGNQKNLISTKNKITTQMTEKKIQLAGNKGILTKKTLNVLVK